MGGLVLVDSVRSGKMVRQFRPKLKRKKPSCPFMRHCFTDSSVCGYIGKYAECPERLEERIFTEVREGGYDGLTPHQLFKVVRHGKVRLG